MCLVTCIVFCHFAYLSQLGLAEHMQAKNLYLHVDWLPASHQGPDGCKLFGCLCLCFRDEKIQSTAVWLYASIWSAHPFQMWWTYHPFDSTQHTMINNSRKTATTKQKQSKEQADHKLLGILLKQQGIPCPCWTPCCCSPGKIWTCSQQNICSNLKVDT